MPLTSVQQALWANQVQRRCLLESDDDIDAGLAAAEYILSTTEPVVEPEDLWITVPDSFLQDLQSEKLSSSVALGASISGDQRPPNVIIHNHVSTPTVHVAAPEVSVNVPKQDAPIINVVTSGPITTGQKKVALKRDNAGNWVGEIKEG